MLIFFLILFILILVFCIYSSKYSNPYKLIMVFGKKGSGKTSSICSLAHYHVKKGWICFSNVPVPGCSMLPPMYWEYELPPHSVVFIDEAGMVHDNRAFKSFPAACRDWYKLQRHRKLKVFLFSQSFDVDLKIRELTDEMWLSKRLGNVFSLQRRIRRSIVLTSPMGDQPSTIADDLQFCCPLIPKNIRLVFLPKWASKFDSFAAPALSPLPDSSCST